MQLKVRRRPNLWKDNSQVKFNWVFTICWDKETLPKMLMEGTIYPIYRKGS